MLVFFFIDPRPPGFYTLPLQHPFPILKKNGKPRKTENKPKKKVAGKNGTKKKKKKKNKKTTEEPKKTITEKKEIEIVSF